MKRPIILLTLLASLASVSVALARDANRDALYDIEHGRQMQQKRWEAVMHSTGNAQQEALPTYLYNQPWLWKIDP